MRHNWTASALVISLLLASAAEADAASCLSPATPAETIAAFNANPESLLTNAPDMRALERSVRNLAATQSTLAQALVGVAEKAKPAQQSAIAAGLAQAAMACLSVDAMASQDIQTAVAGFEDITFQSTFASIAGDLDTAAVAIAAEAAAASVGSAIVVNPQRAPTGPRVSGGGGAASPAVTISLIPVSGTNLSRDGSAAASSVSPVR